MIEGTQLVFEALGLPFIAWRFLSVLVLMGFPVALVLAWVLDLTPEGIRRTKHLTPEEMTGEDLRGGNLTFWAVLVVGVTLAVGSGYLVVFRHTTDSPPPPDRFAGGASEPVAAVFEFENLTGDSALAELGLVTQHQVTAGLSWADGVAVIPAAAVLEFVRGQAHSTSLQDAAVDLGADMMVTGIITKSADRLRFQAQITMLEGGDALPVIEVTGPSRDPMVGVEELENRVMGALVGSPSDPPHSRGLALAAPSYDAVRAYLLGLEMLESEDLFGGLRMLHEAYATDTTFLAPLVLACYVHQMFFDGWYAADSLVRILDSRRTEMSPDEQLSVDFVASALAGDWEGQVRALRPLARHTPSARVPLVAAAFNAGRLEEALEVIGEIDSDSGESERSPSVVRSNANLILGRNTEALEAAQDGKEAYPKDLRFRLLEAKALAALGRKE